MLNQTTSSGWRRRAATPALIFAIAAGIRPLAGPIAEAQAQVPGRARASRGSPRRWRCGRITM